MHQSVHNSFAWSAATILVLPQSLIWVQTISIPFVVDVVGRSWTSIRLWPPHSVSFASSTEPPVLPAPECILDADNPPVSPQWYCGIAPRLSIRGHDISIEYNSIAEADSWISLIGVPKFGEKVWMGMVFRWCPIRSSSHRHWCVWFVVIIFLDCFHNSWHAWCVGWRRFFIRKQFANFFSFMLSFELLSFPSQSTPVRQSAGRSLIWFAFPETFLFLEPCSAPILLMALITRSVIGIFQIRGRVMTWPVSILSSVWPPWGANTFGAR